MLNRKGKAALQKILQLTSLKTSSNVELMKLGKKLKLPKLRIYAIDSVPLKFESNQAVIVNSGELATGGTHWVSCFIRKDQCIYYDPFGVEPDKRLLKVMKNTRQKVVGITIQSQANVASSCGYWCLYFLDKMNKKWSLGKFMSVLDIDEQSKNEKLLYDFISSI